MATSKSLQYARQYLDKQNIKIINSNPVGTIIRLTYLNDNGVLIPFETIVTSNERSEKMVKTKAIRFNENQLIDLTDETDDGFVSD